jgi:hypothetical protein
VKAAVQTGAATLEDELELLLDATELELLLDETELELLDATELELLDEVVLELLDEEPEHIADVSWLYAVGVVTVVEVEVYEATPFESMPASTTFDAATPALVVLP